MENLVCNWYGWVVFVAVFLAAAATIYVFFDSQELSTPNPANSARILAAIGTVLTLPALYLRMTETFPPSCALDPMTLKSMLAVISNADVFSYLGIAGVLLGLGAGVYYYAGIKSPPPPPLPPPPIT
ncbi:MAG: hypothetical protein KC418_01835, partial [Anaerolineales bacterium]|nr:hypothetical protein [Anaerolineales bacterium]